MKPIQLEDFVTDCVNHTMRGNAGIAIVKLRGQELIGYQSGLSRKIVEIELAARKQIRATIEEEIKNYTNEQQTTSGTQA